MIKKLLLLYVAIICSVSLPAMEAPAENSRILLYGDKHLADVFKAVKKNSGKTLKDRKIKLDVKNVKGATVAALKEAVSKDLLAKKPQVIVLAIGRNDVWDSKDKKAVEFEVDQLTADLIAIINILREAGVNMLLITPAALGDGDEDEGAAEQAAMSGACELLKSVAEKTSCELYDVHAMTLLNAATIRKGKSISKEGAQLLSKGLVTRLGLTPSSLPALKDGDRIIIFTDEQYYSALDTRIVFGDRSAPPLQQALRDHTGRKVALSIIGQRMEPGLSTDPGQIANQKPNILILNMGVNELNRNKTPEQFRSNLIATIENGRKTGAIMYLMTHLPYSKTAPFVPGSAEAKPTADYAAVVNDVGKKMGIPVIDQHAQALEYFKAHPTIAFLKQRDPVRGGYIDASMEALEFEYVILSEFLGIPYEKK